MKKVMKVQMQLPRQKNGFIKSRCDYRDMKLNQQQQQQENDEKVRKAWVPPKLTHAYDPVNLIPPDERTLFTPTPAVHDSTVDRKGNTFSAFLRGSIHQYAAKVCCFNSESTFVIVTTSRPCKKQKML